MIFIILTTFLIGIALAFILAEYNKIDVLVEKKAKKYYIKRFKGYFYIYDKKIYYEAKRLCNRFEFYINNKKVYTHYYDSRKPPYVALLTKGYKGYSSFDVSDDTVNFKFEAFRLAHKVGRHEWRFYEVYEKGLSNEECKL